MTKSLSAKTGTYTNAQGEQKNRYTKVGVILSGTNGEYALLDPTVNLAGILLQQNAMSGESRTSVMISVFDDSRQQQPNQQQMQPAASQPAQQHAGGAQQAAQDSFAEDSDVHF